METSGHDLKVILKESVEKGVSWLMLTINVTRFRITIDSNIWVQL